MSSSFFSRALAECFYARQKWRQWAHLQCEKAGLDISVYENATRLTGVNEDAYFLWEGTNKHCQQMYSGERWVANQNATHWGGPGYLSTNISSECGCMKKWQHIMRINIIIYKSMVQKISLLMQFCL